MSVLDSLARHNVSRYFKLIVVVWDLILLNSAILLSAWMRYGFIDRLFLKEVETISLVSNAVWIFLLLGKDANRSIRLEPIEVIIMRTIRKFVIHSAIIAFFVVFLKYNQISRLQLFYFYVTFFGLLLLSRYVSMLGLKYVRAKGFNFKKFIIVGANAAGEQIHNTLSKDLTYGYRFLGFFDQDVAPGTSSGLRIKGDFAMVEKLALANAVDEIYVALSIDKIDTIHQLIKICEKQMVRIKFIPDFQLYTKASKVDISFYGNTPVLMFRTEPLEYTVNRLLKKTFDLVFSLAVMVLIFPWLFPIIMILIKLESPGPVFFMQERTGRDKESFLCWKFRSMHCNQQADQLQAGKGDRRVTTFGAFMRKTSIDELPQFINVFLGEMSVVGPRPHMVNHTEQYSSLINNYFVRHYAKPGITGWAQINGYRGETKKLEDMQNRVAYDIWYIENWSILLDLKIIFKTVTNVFKGEENAY